MAIASRNLISSGEPWKRQREVEVRHRPRDATRGGGWLMVVAYDAARERERPAFSPLLLELEQLSTVLETLEIHASIQYARSLSS